MKKILQINIINLFLLFTTGCSLFTFSDQQDELTQDGEFTQTATSTRNPSSTQADVAAEFNSLITQRGFAPPSLESTQYSDYYQHPIYLPQNARSNYYRLKPKENFARRPSAVNSFEPSFRLENNVNLKTAKLGAHSYKVKPGDTLMKISFEKYGDILKWKDILNENRNSIQNPEKLEVGMELKISGETYVVVEKNGQPYLIKKGDTLLRVSKNVYGSQNFWKEIWQNNLALIKNPNKIYAGFTIYTANLNEMNSPRPLSNLLGSTNSADQQRSPSSDKSQTPQENLENINEIKTNLVEPELRPAYPNRPF